MSWVLKLFNNCAISSGRLHVNFSPSTLQKQRERTLQHIASPIPMNNFVNEIRLNALDDLGRDRMTMAESARLRRKALLMWPKLPQTLKDKYQQIATDSFRTRLPAQCVDEVKSTPHFYCKCKDRTVARKKVMPKPGRPKKITQTQQKKSPVVKKLPARSRSAAPPVVKQRAKKRKLPMDTLAMPEQVQADQFLVEQEQVEQKETKPQLKLEQHQPQLKLEQHQPEQLHPEQPHSEQPHSDQLQSEQLQPEKPQPEQQQPEQLQPEQHQLDEDLPYGLTPKRRRLSESK